MPVLPSAESRALFRPLAPRKRSLSMKLRRIIEKTVRRQGKGIDLASDVNAVISANVNERDSSSRVSSRQRIVQRDGRTVEVSRSVQSKNRDNDRREEP